MVTSEEIDRFDLVFELIDQTQATWTFMVPTMWASMQSANSLCGLTHPFGKPVVPDV